MPLSVPPRLDLDELVRSGGKRAGRRRGEKGLAAGAAQALGENGAAVGIELGEHVVEEQQRPRIAPLRE